MGCASSKGVGVKSSTKDIYSPLPSSFALFDINSIKEPWLSIDNTSQVNYEKSSHLPAPILQKLNTFEADVPHSWDEVSKALQDLKPSLHGEKEDNVKAAKPVISAVVPGGTKQIIRRSSFHTVEELDAKLSVKQEKDIRPRKSESFKTDVKKPQTEKRELAATESNAPIIKPVKDNPFILRDRMEREKEGKMANYDKLMKMKRDPLSDFPEKCPPGGANSVVLYTTSLRGVRKTYEDCNTLRELLEGQRVVVDERDVSLHGKFLNELKDLVGGVSVPRLFVKGRYIGGVVEVTELNESGRFGRLLSWAGVERGVGRQACEGCGGARFVPCVECGGSCKVLVDGVKERCEYCNENGLALCPACH